MSKRTRYQSGSLTIEKRKTVPDAWVFRWRDTAAGGTRVKRKMIVGNRANLPTRRDALRAIDALRLEINADVGSEQGRRTLADVWLHYETAELASDRLSPSTKTVYRNYYHSYIEPSWASYRLIDVRAASLEVWLQRLPYAPGTKAKIRNILSALYQHAIRQEWIDRNPIRDVRQSAKRENEPDILEPAEMQKLILHLPEPCRTMALVAALTGLRVSEIIGLQWHDVDFDSSSLLLRRGVVNREVTPLKTAGSARALPIPAPVVEALRSWKQQTFFKSAAHWVFASPHLGGKCPYWPGTLLQKVLQPTARELGINKRIGWHTFRRSLATLLHSSGADVKTTQELLRHASPNVTLGVYAQAITSEKRAAQERISGLIMDPGRELLLTSA